MPSPTLSHAGLGVTSASLTSAAAISAAFGQQLATDDQPRTIETVTVTDRRLTIGLLPEKLLDTPQSVNVIPAEVIKEQGVSTLQDALRNVPGITLNAGEGGTHGDLVNLRGFPAGDDYFLDGLRDTGLYTRDTFNYEVAGNPEGPCFHPVRPWHCRRRHQPGFQGAAALSRHGFRIDRRHQCRNARHR